MPISQTWGWSKKVYSSEHCRPGSPMAGRTLAISLCSWIFVVAKWACTFFIIILFLLLWHIKWQFNSKDICLFLIYFRKETPFLRMKKLFVSVTISFYFSFGTVFCFIFSASDMCAICNSFIILWKLLLQFIIIVSLPVAHRHPFVVCM